MPTLVPTLQPSPVPTLQPTPLPTPVPTSSPTRIRCAPGKYSLTEDVECDFGSGFCAFSNTGVYNWSWGSPDLTSKAGPSVDRTTGYGSFAYASASGNQNDVRSYVLEATLGNGTSTGNFVTTFWYHMSVAMDASSVSLAVQALDPLQLDKSGAYVALSDDANASVVPPWATMWNRTVTRNTTTTTITTTTMTGNATATTFTTAIAATTNSSHAWQLSQPLVVMGSRAERVRFVATLHLAAGGGKNASVSLDDVHFDSDCTECPAGTYKNFYGSDFCDDCDRGSYCETTGLLAPTSICSPGRYAGFGHALCTPCPAGQYQVELESFNCTACSAGLYEPTTGATSCVILCPAGRYSEGGNGGCDECPAGQYGTQTGQSSCILCEGGTYMDGTGATECEVNSCCVAFVSHSLRVQIKDVCASNHLLCRTATLGTTRQSEVGPSRAVCASWVSISRPLGRKPAWHVWRESSPTITALIASSAQLGLMCTTTRSVSGTGLGFVILPVH